MFTPAKTIFLLLLATLLSACYSQQVLVREQDFAAAEQCLLDQQQQQQQMLEQQQQFMQTLASLNDILAKPLQVNAPLIEFRQEQAAADCTVPATRHEAPGQEHTVADHYSNKQLVGEIEEVWFPQLGLTLLGRIDTGATTASLDARNIQIFERDGEQWVRFSVNNPETGTEMEFERKRVRKVRITQSNSDTPERRPVVELQVKIGGISQLAEFTLSDRSHLDYQTLIGRNILRDVMLVDVSQRHLAPLQKNGKP